MDRALLLASNQRGEMDLCQAWHAFRAWFSTSRVDEGSEDWRLFLAWYLFHWQAPARPSIAEWYVSERPSEVSAEEVRMVATASRSPLDFYEIHTLPEMGCFYVKSLFLGYQQSYAFAELPDGLKVGDVFFGKVIHFQQDEGVIAGHSPAFPPSAKVPIAYLKRQLILRRKDDFLNNFSMFESDLFNLYHDLLSLRMANQ